MRRIIFPHQPGSGGPGSFQRRFEYELKNRGYEIGYAGERKNGDIIFVVGGTGKILWLIKMKFLKVPIIFRMDGINWLHKTGKIKTNIITYWNSEKNNLLTKIIHAFLADFIVYQSLFVKKWWDHKGWKLKSKNYTIIYNGIKPQESKIIRENSKIKVVCLEGYVDYSPFAIDLINKLNQDSRFEIIIYGDIYYDSNRKKLLKEVNYQGKLPRENVFQALQGNIYLSLDIHPACPNTVVEALSAGAPVIGFDTGSLSELVMEDAGIIVNYGSDPWKLDFPNIELLIDAIVKIQGNYNYYSKNALKLAKDRFTIEDMTDKYLNVIETLINK